MTYSYVPLVFCVVSKLRHVQLNRVLTDIAQLVNGLIGACTYWHGWTRHPHHALVLCH